MAVTFALFETLVDADVPEDTAAAVGAELRSRGVDVPPDWPEAFAEARVDAPDGAEVPLPAQVARALASLGVDAPGNLPRRAVVSAFDPDVRTRPGAAKAVERARERGPVGLLVNCRVPELVGRVLARAEVSRRDFDAVTTSTASGWRVPHPEAFETHAAALGDGTTRSVTSSDLVVVASDPAYEAVTDLGGRFVDARETPLTRLDEEL